MQAKITTVIFDGYAITIDKDKGETTVVRDVFGVKTTTTIGWAIVGNMMEFITSIKKRDSKMAKYYKIMKG